MRAVETEAKTRNCRQIVVETHDFQAPGFYQKLGFDVVGRVRDYPQGHQYLTLVKHLDRGAACQFRVINCRAGQ